MPHRFAVIATACTLSAACNAPTDPADDEDLGSASEALVEDDSFEVDFLDCTEMAGVGVIPYDNARAVVPEDYQVVDAGGVALLVVRVANCEDVELDGDSIGGGTVAQIGVVIVPPDGDGDINNFTLHYDTDSAELADALKDANVGARYVPGLSYEVTASETHLSIHAPKPSKARYHVEGTIAPPPENPVPFVANWWDVRGQRETKMNTVLDAISFGGAQMTLTTLDDSPLPALMGGTSLTFPVLDSYNAFGDAHMVVSVR